MACYIGPSPSMGGACCVSESCCDPKKNRPANKTRMSLRVAPIYPERAHLILNPIPLCCGQHRWCGCCEFFPSLHAALALGGKLLILRQVSGCCDKSEGQLQLMRDEADPFRTCQISTYQFFPDWSWEGREGTRVGGRSTLDKRIHVRQDDTPEALRSSALWRALL